MYIYIYIYISELGGSTTQKSFRLLRACVRCEAACARGTMLLPTLGGGGSLESSLACRALPLLPVASRRFPSLPVALRCFPQR